MSHSSKNILITGGLGFIGFNLVKRLAKSFNNIYVIDSLISNTINSFSENIKNVEVHNIDLNDIDKLIPIVEKSDLIIHLAAKGNVVESVSNPLDNFNSNVITTLNLLEVMKKSSNCKKIIFSSTGGALMGDTLPPVDEKSSPRPISPYGASKLACEGYINAYSKCFNIKSIIFRFGNVYGKYSSHKKGVINQFIRNSLKKDKHKVFGSIKSSRDYIHVKDICYAIELGILHIEKMSTNNEIFHLANNEEICLEDLINQINIASKKITEYVINDFRDGEVFKNYSSYKKAKKELGFSPKVFLKDGIDELYKWIEINEFHS